MGQEVEASKRKRTSFSTATTTTTTATKQTELTDSQPKGRRDVYICWRQARCHFVHVDSAELGLEWMLANISENRHEQPDGFQAAFSVV